MDKNCHDVLEQKMCKELEMIQTKYAQNPALEMTVQDLERVDKLYHALKSMATYTAMKEAEEYADGGMSGRRGRATNGQYISRTGGGMSYDEGYRNGYADGQSGYHPMPGYGPRSW